MFSEARSPALDRPLVAIGLALVAVAAGYALWVFGGIGNAIILNTCGAPPPIFPDVERYLAFSDCVRSVETRAMLIGATVSGIAVGWVMRAALKREAGRDQRRDDELEAEIARIRASEPK